MWNDTTFYELCHVVRVLVEPTVFVQQKKNPNILLSLLVVFFVILASSNIWLLIACLTFWHFDTAEKPPQSKKGIFFQNQRVSIKLIYVHNFYLRSAMVNRNAAPEAFCDGSSEQNYSHRDNKANKQEKGKSAKEGVLKWTERLARWLSFLWRNVPCLHMSDVLGEQLAGWQHVRNTSMCQSRRDSQLQLCADPLTCATCFVFEKERMIQRQHGAMTSC